MRNPIILIPLLVALSSVQGVKAQSPKPFSPRAAYPEWKSRITYELYVRSFYDSNGDGIGDLKGATQKLPYLKKLGIEAIWLMPINPSPSYHKYDVTDYKAIDPEYGTMADFKAFLAEAHTLGIKVIPDLVVNHTSTDHPWFKAAAANAKSPYRNYYIWTSSPDSTKDWYASPNPKDRQKYYAMFWEHMPDLNYDNPAVRKEIIEVGKFWLKDVGVDGFRLDAARHIYYLGQREKTLGWWKQFQAEMLQVKPDAYIVGEVWDSSRNVAPYFPVIEANFNFELHWRLQTSLKSEADSGIATGLAAARKLYAASAPDFIDPTILANHDQPRILNELGKNAEKAKLAATIQFTLPGQPYIYYGEEIGMLGPKPDPEIREPFLWDIPSKDMGRTHWEKAIASTDSTVVPEAQQELDSNSFFTTYRRLIALRKNNKLLSDGELVPVTTHNPYILAYYRTDGKDSLLVIHNLSAHDQSFPLPQGYTSILHMVINQPMTMRKDLVTLSRYGSIVLSR